MKAQKSKCDAMLAQKDALIAELKHDLKEMDESYFRDLEKQDNDIKELSERIEKQITIMQRAYTKQLGLISVAVNIERDTLLDLNNKRWEGLYKQCDKEEIAHMEYIFVQLDEHKQEIEAVMWDHHEKYRVAKIELESLIQDLQQELEKLKATCSINTEKIGYTYQVLKKREEENVFVRSQQKRKINKMSDVANSLRAKIRKAAEDGAIEEIKADAEIIKLMQTMDDLEKKSDRFSYVNHNKFTQVWRMSNARCIELTKELRHGEVALHAHILAEPPPPAPQRPDRGPLSKYEAEAKLALTVEDPKDMVPDPNNEFTESKDRLVRHILQLVADNTGFLVEDRLLTLIKKYQSGSRNLCTLDAIFMALEIQADEDIDLLCGTFLNYAFCPICTDSDVESEEDNGHDQPTSEALSKVDTQSGMLKRAFAESRQSSCKIRRSASVSTTRTQHIGFRNVHELTPLEQLMLTEADEILQKCGDIQSTAMVTADTPEGGSVTSRRPGGRAVCVVAQGKEEPGFKNLNINPFVCAQGHLLEMEPMQVLTALSEFITIFVSPEKQKLNDILDSLKPPNFETPSRKLTEEEIKTYWLQWKNMFTPEKDKFWDGLLTGLNNYLSILQERERIHNEVLELRRRNVALRQLVRGSLPELPPPKRARAQRKAFVAPTEDTAPYGFDRLPPI